jgi:hypothetical protein
MEFRTVAEANMKYQVEAGRCAALFSLVLFGSILGGCSSESSAKRAGGGAATTSDTELPFDPQRPGAALLCDRPELPEGAEGRTMYFVVSAMNFKLRQYPEFAAAIGVDLVSDCDAAFRYEQGLALYSAEHPGFDADEPLAPLPTDTPEPPPPSTQDDGPDQAPIDKIFGGNVALDNSVVHLQFSTCTRAGCPAADTSWIVNGKELRRNGLQCSGTFIAKNWILTAAHCVTLSAVDQCMEKGISRSACVPNWDHYASWRISGSYSTDHGMDGIPSTDDGRRDYDFHFQARAYVISNWPGRDLSQNPNLCPTCNTSTAIDDDLALLYVSTNDDPILPPRTDDDVAKRISTIPPDLSWSMSLEGWGDPSPGAATALRTVNGPWAFQKSDQQIYIEDEPSRYPCPGDSGGALTRNGVQLATADGQRSVDALIGVISSGSARCDGMPEPKPVQSFRITRIDTARHLQFIRDSMKRWPYLQGFSCINKGPVTSGNVQPLEMMECWGAPCEDDSKCKKTETCWHSAREVEQLPLACNCAGFPSPLNEGCNCMLGECLPD